MSVFENMSYILPKENRPQDLFYPNNPGLCTILLVNRLGIIRKFVRNATEWSYKHIGDHEPTIFIRVGQRDSFITTRIV